MALYILDPGRWIVRDGKRKARIYPTRQPNSQRV